MFSFLQSLNTSLCEDSLNDAPLPPPILANHFLIQYQCTNVHCKYLMLLCLLNADGMRTAVFLVKPSSHLDAGWVWYLIFEDSEHNNVCLASLSCDLGLGHWHWLEILQDSLLEDLEEFWPLVIKRKVWSNIAWVSTFLDSPLMFFLFQYLRCQLRHQSPATVTAWRSVSLAYHLIYDKSK